MLVKIRHCMEAIHAIEYARRARFRILWLECDLTLVCKAFFHQKIVSWFIVEFVGGNALTFIEIFNLKCHIFFDKKIIVQIS